MATRNAAANYQRLEQIVNHMNKRLNTKNEKVISIQKVGDQAKVSDIFEQKFVNLSDKKLHEIGKKMRDCKTLSDFWRDIDGSPNRRKRRSSKKNK